MVCGDATATEAAKVCVDVAKAHFGKYHPQSFQVIELKEINTDKRPLEERAICEITNDYITTRMKKDGSYWGGTGARMRSPWTVKPADVPYPVQMEPNLVIEFYSR